MIIPKHVAIIMDGNGRWGIKHKGSRNLGHNYGTKTVEFIIDAAIDKKIKFLTLYALSTENWKRPITEIQYLLMLLEKFIDKQLRNISKKNIKIKILGNIRKFPIKLRNKLKKAEKLTKLNKKIQINIALNYGSRQEMIQSIKKINQKKISVNEKNISENMYTSNIPDPEILIRTGNTKRLSNFLMWQSIYSEIFFINKLWPDFEKKDFYKILNKFHNINRKFGGLNDRVAK